MTLTLAMVCEAPADFRTATELADRILIETIDWLEPELIEHQRTWLGEVSGSPLTWKQIKHLSRENRIQISGFFDGNPGEPDALAARRAILLLRHLLPVTGRRTPDPRSRRSTRPAGWARTGPCSTGSPVSGRRWVGGR